MGMDIVNTDAAIQELHQDSVANLCANNRSQQAQPLGLRFSNRECAVGVFNEAGLGPLSLLAPGHGQMGPVYQIPLAGGIVPGCIFGGDVVVTGGSAAKLSCKNTRGRTRTEGLLLSSDHPGLGYLSFAGGSGEAVSSEAVFRSEQSSRATASLEIGQCLIPDIAAVVHPHGK